MGRVERHVGKFLEPPCPPPLGTPGSFPGIGTDMLGAPGLGPGVSGESVNRCLLLASPLRRTERAPGGAGVRGHWERAAARSSFGITPARRVSAPPFPPPL